MFPLKFILLSYLLILVFCGKAERKRILVNDPDFLLQKLQSMESKLQELTGTIAQQQTTINMLRSQQMSQGSGAVFVRWGRTTCPDNGTELVYAGYTGGTRFERHGGVADYVCIPPDPNLGQTTLDNDTNVQQIYGGNMTFQR